ncbi:uncharacterized protein JCM6883_004280 [Sporobolomyces salmoneus]|uniref:uncharacterized protein n=1 Tax=Sporobolomyces salmoneus TaxID=183962 RepID=UPI00316E6A0A
MFIAPVRATSPSTPTNAKPTLLSKIGALRRVSSFSSLSSRTPSPPTTPTAPTSPTLSEYDPLPQDIPRSSSVMSWFSSDEETDSSRKPWRIPRLRRKTRMSPKNPTFTFTTSPSAFSSEEITPCSSLGAPLHLSSEPTLLPAVHPIELDLALDFDCAFPRPYDSDDSDPTSSPPFTPQFHSIPRYLEAPVVLKRPRESVCWYGDEREEEEDSRTLYGLSLTSSSDASPGLSSPRSSISRRSPEMTEEEDEDSTFGKFEREDEANPELDEEVCRKLAAFRILPTPPALVATPRSTPHSLRSSSSEESLLDPHFDSPSTPSPSALYSPTFSTSPYSPRKRTRTTGFSFPLPPTTSSTNAPPCQKEIPQISFLGLEIEEDDDSPWFDCNP